MGELDHLKDALAAGRIGRRDFLNRAAALGASLALADSLLASAAVAAETPTKGGHLILGLNGAGAGDSLDPATYTATFAQVLGQQLYSTLTEVDEKVKVQPALAESWEAKPDAKEWVFRIRKGVTFHNDKTLTAADVVYSINHHRAKDSKSAAKALLTSITDIKASDPNEVTIILESGNADMPYILADYHIGIGPEGTNFTDGIGTGCFTLESFEPGVRARTKLNPNKWRTERGFVDSVETIAINDTTARVNALISGSAHLINRVDPKTVGLLKNSKNVQIHEIAGAAHYTFPMRCDTAPFDNNDLRLALKYAIDRDAIVKTVLLGHGKTGNDQPIASFDPFYGADLPQYKFDPDKAKFHLKKSGFSGPITLTVSDGAFTGAVDAAQIFQSSAGKAGVTLQLDRVPADGYWDNVWLKKPFCASYWDGRPTADQMLTVVYKSDAPWNESFWKRPDFDKLLVEARAELDQAKRKEMYRELETMVHDDSGNIIPMFNNTIDAGSTKVKGFVPTPTLQMSGYRATEKVWLET
ncbi:MAG: ABC transporter substrate-binding protein [Alphaproteobacteria bacterium]|nr:ABC transporter substrate-binding protein [Alphaproteobacteria bacterium]